MQRRLRRRRHPKGLPEQAAAAAPRLRLRGAVRPPRRLHGRRQRPQRQGPGARCGRARTRLSHRAAGAGASARRRRRQPARAADGARGVRGQGQGRGRRARRALAAHPSRAPRWIPGAGLRPCLRPLALRPGLAMPRSPHRVRCLGWSLAAARPAARTRRGRPPRRQRRPAGARHAPKRLSPPCTRSPPLRWALGGRKAGRPCTSALPARAYGRGRTRRMRPPTLASKRQRPGCAPTTMRARGAARTRFSAAQAQPAQRAPTRICCSRRRLIRRSRLRCRCRSRRRRSGCGARPGAAT